MSFDPKEMPNYESLGTEIGKLVSEKQIAYGDSFGKGVKYLQEMFPSGLKPDQFEDALTIARILDKLFRIANDKGAFGESPYKDIVGYSLLALGREHAATLQRGLDQAKEGKFVPAPCYCEYCDR